MAGGLMQLVAYGAQDIYLTGNPQITFFKVVYRRHTNFSMECIKQNISGQSYIGTSSINNKGSVTISRNGDLVVGIFVCCDQNTAEGICGDHLVEDVEIEIGGQRIDKHYREWNQIWNELTIPSSKARRFKYMTGGYNNNLVSGGETYGTNQQTIQYPLNFWFCRNPGLALPLIALQYHEVQLKFTWGVGHYTSSNNENLTRKDQTLTSEHQLEVWVDYVYLDTDERRRFSQVSHEYLIEQVQIQKEKDVNNSLFKLNLEHPVKELIWTTPTLYPITNQKIKLEINGHDRFNERDKEYFTLTQPYNHHTSVPGYNIKEDERPQLLSVPEHGGTYLVRSTTASPIVLQDSNCSIGYKLASKTINDSLTIASSNHMVIRTGSTTALFNPKVGDLIHITYVDASKVNNVQSSSYIQNTEVGGVHTRTLTVLSTFTSEDTLVSGKTIQEIEFDSNILTNGGSSLSTIISEDQKDNISFEIIARIQNPQSRCSQLKKDIYVYSFCLEPEEHQPSGTCNFSRIDNARLVLSTTSHISNIYAVNYNVLRILSGMAGLAYSS